MVPNLSGSMFVWIGGIYLVVLLLHVTKLGLSIIAINRVKQEADFNLPDGAQLLLNRLCRRMGIKRKVKLGVCPGSNSPLTYGALHPEIILPEYFYYDDLKLLESVLIHELGHIKKYDQLKFVLAYSLASLNWFNPFIWFALKRFNIVSEFACDDEVIINGNNPALFANQLVTIAKYGLGNMNHSIVSRPMLWKGQLPLRIDNLLRGNCLSGVRRTHSSNLPISSLFAVFVLASVGNILALDTTSNFYPQDLRIKHLESPVYPEYAFERGVTGHTQYSFRVNESGEIDPESIVLLNSDPTYIFDEPSIVALKNFRYEPRKANGRFVPTSGVKFRFDFDIRI